MFRLEAERGYKRAKAKSITVDPGLPDGVQHRRRHRLHRAMISDVNGHASVLSLMGNALLDFGDDAASAPISAAVSAAPASRNSATATAPGRTRGSPASARRLSDNIDVGLKYRYFRTGRLNFDDTFTFTGVGNGSGGTATFDAEQPVQLAQPAAEPDLQLRAAAAAAAATAAAAAAAASAASGDADLPGRLGDPGDGRVSAAAARRRRRRRRRAPGARLTHHAPT